MGGQGVTRATLGTVTQVVKANAPFVYPFQTSSLLFVSCIKDAKLVEGPPIQVVDEGAAIHATPAADGVALAYPTTVTRPA